MRLSSSNFKRYQGTVFPRKIFPSDMKQVTLGPFINIQHATDVFDLGSCVNMTSVKLSCFSINTVKMKFLTRTLIFQLH